MLLSFWLLQAKKYPIFDLTIKMSFTADEILEICFSKSSCPQLKLRYRFLTSQLLCLRWIRPHWKLAVFLTVWTVINCNGQWINDYRPSQKNWEGNVFTGVCLSTGGSTPWSLVPGPFWVYPKLGRGYPPGGYLQPHRTRTVVRCPLYASRVHARELPCVIITDYHWIAETPKHAEYAKRKDLISSIISISVSIISISI